MNCPRCHSEIPCEASHCPDCKLPKPKGHSPQNEAVGQKTEAPKKRAANPRSGNKPEQTEQRPKWVTATAGAVAVALLCGLGFYLFHFYSNRQHEVDPKAALPMLNRLRHSPSTQQGLNVDDLLTQELEKSRRVGNLLSYQGWTIRPINGSKTKLLISFSFEESGNTQQRAEWIADLANNTFTPQTDLAVAVYRK